VASQSFCEMLGYAEDVLRTMTFQEITRPEDLAAGLALLEETLAGRRSSYRIPRRYIHADGHLVWGDLSVALLRSEEGSPRARPGSPPLIEQVALRPCRDPQPRAECNAYLETPRRRDLTCATTTAPPRPPSVLATTSTNVAVRSGRTSPWISSTAPAMTKA
jgi:PAS domain-containing protein